MKSVSLIAAVDSVLGLGKDNQIPWHIPEDLKHFKKITTRVSDSDQKNVVIMGRKTWDSIPAAVRPLEGRYNAVLTRTPTLELSGATTHASLADAIKAYQEKDDVDKIFLIGGSSIYKQGLSLCDELFVTRIVGTYDCDVFFPPIPDSKFRLVQSHKMQKMEDSTSFWFERYVAKRK